MAAKLVEAGLIERHPDASDGRAWVLSLTDHGRAALKRVQRSFRAVNGIMDEVLLPQQAEQLAEALTRLAEAFERGLDPRQRRD